MSWTDLLDTSQQDLLQSLQQQHCALVWNDRERHTRRPGPGSSGTIWLEAWQQDHVVFFLGPLACPLSEEEVRRAVELICWQVDVLSQPVP